MSDEIRRLSEELARDPASLAFVPLGEAVRRQGQLDMALRITLRGLERHPYHVDGHDLLARIASDRGETERAMDEWSMVLKLAPQHVGAHKGLGFIRFQQGDLAQAQSHLSAALEINPGDAAIRAALQYVREASGGAPAEEPTPTPVAVVAVPPAAPRATPTAAPRVSQPEMRLSGAVAAPSAAALEDPRYLFADLLFHDDQTALLLDAAGLVLAGAYVDHAANDVSQEIGAALSGVSDEAVRATRHLSIGEWSSIVFQTDVAAVAMAPTSAGGLVVLATGTQTPLGLARRLLDRCVARGKQWLEARS